MVTEYEEFRYFIDNIRIESNSIPNGENIVYKTKGKNLIDISKCIDGYFVNYGNGNLVINSDNKALTNIPLKPNTTYTLSSIQNGDLSQLAFYNHNNEYISGLDNSGKQSSITFTTDSNTYYMGLTIPITVTTGVQLEEGSVVTEYEEFGYFIDESIIPLKLRRDVGETIVVKQDGSGDFDNLREAIEYSSMHRVNTIEIHEGVYDVFDDYSISEINDSSFIGLILPNNIELKGIGDRNKIVLEGVLPISIDSTYRSKISTINIRGNVKMENLTITADGMRYCVHDDSNVPDAVKNIKKCIFIRKKGNGVHYGGKQAWGEGSWSGQEYYFEDCDFITEWNYFAYTSHNNYNLTRPSYHKFTNCSFFTTTGGSLRFETLGSGHEERVDMIGCRMNGHVALTCYVDNTSKIIDHRLYGYANDIVPVIIDGEDKNYTYEFAGQTRKCFNATEKRIEMGVAVMMNSGFTSIVRCGSSNMSRFIGVTIEDIDTVGIVQIGGYLDVRKTGLSDLNIGDKIGCADDGSLIKVIDGDYIGVVTVNGFIKLI